MPNLLNDETRRRRSIYLLPNAFTTANLFAGFYAVVQAMNGRFEAAAIAIFLALVFDGMDGRVARLTNTQSAFGEQYDSMADMISFGAAPALVMYVWAMQGLGRWGWLASFITNREPARAPRPCLRMACSSRGLPLSPQVSGRSARDEEIDAFH